MWLWLWLVEVVVDVVRETLLVRRGESSCLAAGWRVGGRWGGDGRVVRGRAVMCWGCVSSALRLL